MLLYNTLTRKKEVFKPLEDKKVKFYACGPTVYDYPHIGNFRSFFLADLLYRYLTYKGYEVKFVMNITDIDDKTIKRSKEEGVTLKEFTDKYTKIFFVQVFLMASVEEYAKIYFTPPKRIEDFIVMRSIRICPKIVWCCFCVVFSVSSCDYYGGCINNRYAINGRHIINTYAIYRYP